jgi:hypothetical protein
MPSRTTNETKSTADYQLERRIAWALLTVKSPNFRFLHVQAHHPRATRLTTPGSRLVEVNAQGTAVRLSGWVLTSGERDTLKSVVRDVPGVDKLINNVIVAPKNQRRPRFFTTPKINPLSTDVGAQPLIQLPIPA